MFHVVPSHASMKAAAFNTISVIPLDALMLAMDSVVHEHVKTPHNKVIHQILALVYCVRSLMNLFRLFN